MGLESIICDNPLFKLVTPRGNGGPPGQAQKDLPPLPDFLTFVLTGMMEGTGTCSPRHGEQTESLDSPFPATGDPGSEGEPGEETAVFQAAQLPINLLPGGQELLKKTEEVDENKEGEKDIQVPAFSLLTFKTREAGPVTGQDRNNDQEATDPMANLLQAKVTGNDSEAGKAPGTESPVEAGEKNSLSKEGEKKASQILVQETLPQAGRKVKEKERPVSEGDKTEPAGSGVMEEEEEGLPPLSNKTGPAPVQGPQGKGLSDEKARDEGFSLTAGKNPAGETALPSEEVLSRVVKSGDRPADLSRPEGRDSLNNKVDVSNIKGEGEMIDPRPDKNLEPFRPSLGPADQAAEIEGPDTASADLGEAVRTGEIQGQKEDGSLPIVQSPGKSSGAGQPAERLHPLEAARKGLETVLPQGPTLNFKKVGPYSLEVTLEPEGLGELGIELKLTDHHINAQIMVSDRLGKDLIENNLPQLLNELGKAGLQIGEFTVSLKNQGRDQASGHFIRSEPGGRPAENPDPGSGPRAAGDHLIHIII